MEVKGITVWMETELIQAWRRADNEGEEVVERGVAEGKTKY